VTSPDHPFEPQRTQRTQRKNNSLLLQYPRQSAGIREIRDQIVATYVSYWDARRLSIRASDPSLRSG
jgi:hypothetical protein